MMRQRFNIFPLFVALILLSVLVGVSGLSSAGQIGSIQPNLAQASVTSPEQQISVIIQITGSSDQVEGAIESLGGTVTRDLSIINAIAARVPAKAVPELASVQGVGWVSLDAPIISTAKGGNGGGKIAASAQGPIWPSRVRHCWIASAHSCQAGAIHTNSRW